jgi:hypothetical protein
VRQHRVPAPARRKSCWCTQPTHFMTSTGFRNLCRTEVSDPSKTHPKSVHRYRDWSTAALRFVCLSPRPCGAPKTHRGCTSNPMQQCRRAKSTPTICAEILRCVEAEKNLDSAAAILAKKPPATGRDDSAPPGCYVLRQFS